MRRFWAVPAAMVLALHAAPASADAADHTSWESYGLPDSAMPGVHRYDAATTTMSISGSPTHITADITGADARHWSLDLITFGDPLAAGRQIHTDTNYDTGSRLVIIAAGRGCNHATADVTIDEANFNADGLPSSLAMSYSYSCADTGADDRMYGSLAWHAGAPARAVPGITGTPPEQIAELTAVCNYDTVDLTWRHVATPDLARVVVVAKQGATAPKTPSDGAVAYSGTADMASVHLAPGTVWSLSAFGVDTEGLWSTPASVTINGIEITKLRSNHSTVGYGTSAMISGTVQDARTHAAAPGVVDVLARRPGGSTWYTVEKDVQTDLQGVFHAFVDPGRTYDYYVFRNGSSYKLGGAAGPVRIKVTMGVAVAVDHKSIKLGTNFHFRAAVAPNKTTKVSLQRYVGGTWQTVSTKTLAKGKIAAFNVKPTTRGTYRYRVRTAAKGELAAGVSKALKLTVS